MKLQKIDWNQISNKESYFLEVDLCNIESLPDFITYQEGPDKNFLEIIIAPKKQLEKPLQLNLLESFDYSKLNIKHLLTVAGKYKTYFNIKIKDKDQLHIEFNQILKTDYLNSALFTKGVVEHNAKLAFHSNMQPTKDFRNLDLENQKHFIVMDKGQVISRPQLNNLYKGVKAGHGLTISSLNPHDIYYLKSRNLSNQAARELLLGD